MVDYESLLECQICLEEYNANSRKPLFLGCGHTYCSSCLNRLYKYSIVKCPVDNKRYTYSDFSKIPANYQLLSCLNINNKNRETRRSSENKRQYSNGKSNKPNKLKFKDYKYSILISISLIILTIGLSIVNKCFRKILSAFCSSFIVFSYYFLYVLYYVLGFLFKYLSLAFLEVVDNICSAGLTLAKSGKKGIFD